jgi:tripartite ATP-independent transporter DctM subunit
MSPEIVGFIGVALMLFFLFARMWVAFAMALVGFYGIAYLQGFNQAFLVAGTAPYGFISKYSLTTLPMFILMGNVIAETGIGTDLFYAADKWVGQLRGGLAMATVLACALLAAITGISSVALVTMGKIALPEMRKHGYAEPLATGSIACAGTLAFLIPPSVAFILYGIMTEQSVGLLFMAGILPGMLLAGLFTATIMIFTAFRPKAGPAGARTNFKEKIVSLKGVWAVLALFILVLGGIYMGVFTPTEAGAVGAGGAILISLIRRRLSGKSFRYSLVDTGLMTAMVLLLMMGVSIFIKFMAISKLPFLLSTTISQLTVPPLVIFAGIVLLYIILGMFTDIIASILLTIPILYPVVISLGFDPIWFGVMVVIVIEMGLVTPPVGMDVFVLGGITGIPIGTIFRGVWPFCVAMIICIVILTIFPQIALFIPGTMK